MEFSKTVGICDLKYYILNTNRKQYDAMTMIQSTE